jgi:putative endonuclease
MVYVYAIKNSHNNEVYVGITKHPEQRLKEHNSGKNRYIKAFIPWIIFYMEEYPDYEQARKREKQLKTTVGKRFLKKE